MKSIIIIVLVFLAGLASAYTPEQQTTLDSMNLSFQLGIAYEKAIQGQNVAEFNALVDTYNAWIRQLFGEDVNLLITKINYTPTVAVTSKPIDTPTVAVSPKQIDTPLAEATPGYKNVFEPGSELSKFGKKEVRDV